MILRYPLLTLPIHRRSRDKYCSDHDRYVEQEKARLGSSYGYRFDQLTPEMQAQWESLWWWPPWRFNDIIGYLDIGMDIGGCLTAEIYLRWKSLPRSSRERQRLPNDRHLPLPPSHVFLLYCEIPRFRVFDMKSNEAFVEALHLVVKCAIQEIKERNRSFQLCLPQFDFTCFNFAEAYRQIKEKEAQCGKTTS